MPLTFVRTFRVRHHECNALGFVAPANYLRYMQETAFDASAAAGYDLECYARMGRSWLIRETRLEYLRSLRYGDTVEVRTWVADFRRVRSRRAYEISMAGSRQTIATALTDWAFLEVPSLRPAAIPAEMIAAFIPEGVPQAAPARAHTPFPAIPEETFRTRRHVHWSDLDSAKHVNNAVHLAYIEECAMGAAAAVGWPVERLKALGVWIVPARQQIDYLQPALLGDELEMVTWACRGGAPWLPAANPAVRYSITMRVDDGAPLVRSRTAFGAVHLSTGLDVPIPDDLLDDLAPAGNSDFHRSGAPGAPEGTEE